MTDAERPATAEFVAVEYTKWRRQLHYSYRMRTLGEDEHGVWGCCLPGEQVHKAGEPAFIRDSSLLLLIPRAGDWSATWYPPSEERLEVYIDINTSPVWSSSSVSMIDLDLDVLRHRDGTVELLDEDEFDEHRIAYDYPLDLVSFARSAAAATMTLAEAPKEPFGRAWHRWYKTLHRL